MTARTDLNKAVTLGNMLEGVSTAIAILNGGGSVVAVVVADTQGNGITVSGISLNPANLLTMLTNRQSAIQAQLTALGVT